MECLVFSHPSVSLRSVPPSLLHGTWGLFSELIPHLCYQIISATIAQKSSQNAVKFLDTATGRPRGSQECKNSCSASELGGPLWVMINPFFINLSNPLKIPLSQWMSSHLVSGTFTSQLPILLRGTCFCRSWMYCQSILWSDHKRGRRVSPYLLPLHLASLCRSLVRISFGKNQAILQLQGESLLIVLIAYWDKIYKYRA